MKNIKHIDIIFGLLLVLGSAILQAQNPRKMVREGNNQYEEGEFADAEVRYRKALEKNPNYFKGKFNLGDAMYEQENFEESSKIFNELSERQLKPEEKANVLFNLGNNLMSVQKYGEAVEAYKNCLRLNPGDLDAKYNLEYARKKLQDQQQQQQNQDQNQDQQQDKQEQQQQDQYKDDQQKEQEQQEQEQDQQQQQNQDQQKNEQSDQQKQQQQQPQQISKEDAQKMLDALKNDEKQTLQELQKQKAKAVKGRKSEIDW